MIIRTLILILSLTFSLGLYAANADPYVLDMSDYGPDDGPAPSKEVKREPKATPTKAKVTKIEESADDEETIDFGEESQKRAQRGFLNSGVAVFPIYEKVDSSTSALGLDFTYFFRRYGEQPKSSPSFIRTMFVAGQNQYANMGVSFNNYWNNELNNLYTSVQYERRFAGFYQISAQKPLLLGTYKSADFNFDLVYRQKVFRDIYLGGKYELESDSMTLRTPNSIFSETTFRGLTGGSASGIGVVFGNLPLEEVLSPKSSFAFQITNMAFLTALGGKSNFGRHTFDVRDYLNPFSNHIIALQFYMNLLSGSPTYKQLSNMGDVFRAYFQDKYMDYHLIALRGEYRFPLFSRFTLTANLGVGYHSNAISKFRLNNYLPSYGAGFRYVLNTDLNMCVRLDYFEGRDSRGFMLGIGESF